MPSLDATRGILEAQFVAGWANKTKIRFDNVTFNDDGLDAFVSVQMINYTSTNVTIGSIKRKRHEGVLSIDVFTKQNIGAGKAYSYVDDIGLFMDNTSQTNLFTGASESRRSGENEGGWYTLIVDVPYTSDEV